MNLDDPTEVIRWALRHAADDLIVDVMLTSGARTITDAYHLTSRCDALADDPTLGGLATHSPDAWAARERMAHTALGLTEALIALGDEYGQAGVAQAARDLVNACQGAAEAQGGVRDEFDRARRLALWQDGHLASADWPPPQPGDHESELRLWWGPIIAGLPGTDCDDTWYAAEKWSRSNRKGAA